MHDHDTITPPVDGRTVPRADHCGPPKQAVNELSRLRVNSNGAHGDQALAAAVRSLRDILVSTAPNRASLAAQRAHAFFEAMLAGTVSGQTIACTEGCTFCCYTNVFATAPEVFLVANALRQQHPADLTVIIERIGAAASAVGYASNAERINLRIPCPLLQANRCSVYAERPGACRGLTSTSMRACEQGFNKLPTLVVTPALWKMLSNAERKALWAALEGAGLSWESYAFLGALLITLQTPDAETRWLAGEDVFAGVARNSPTDAARAATIHGVIKDVLADALGQNGMHAQQMEDGLSLYARSGEQSKPALEHDMHWL